MQLVDYAPEVRAALDKGKAVIALESSIIAQGMPIPHNLETALQVEAIARDMGVVPATTAILGGRIKVGLSQAEIAYLAEANGVVKVSRKDFASTLARGKDGATTVAATMSIAHLAGISVFATGGIGGVHREGECTFDISADLQEFSRTPVLVVSAGAKAILDLPKTLETLETLGVPVIGYQTDVFPAFYSRDSRLPLDIRMDSPTEIARTYRTQRALGFSAGLLVANPIPPEHEIPKEEMDETIEQALAALKKAGVSGKAVTPFLLTRISEMTGSRSLEANKRLVENNVRLACRIALELERI